MVPGMNLGAPHKEVEVCMTTKKTVGSVPVTKPVTIAANQSAAVAAGASTAPPTPAPTGTGNTGSSGTTTAPILSAKTSDGLRAKIQQMLAGIQAAIPDGSQLGFVNGPTTKEAVVAALSADLAIHGGGHGRGHRQRSAA